MPTVRTNPASSPRVVSTLSSRTALARKNLMRTALTMETIKLTRAMRIRKSHCRLVKTVSSSVARIRIEPVLSVVRCVKTS